MALFLPAVWKRLSGLFRNSTTSNPSRWLIDWVRGSNEADSGIAINGKTALSYSTVWQSVNIISGDVSILPLNLYRRMDDQNREKAMQHASFRLMRRRPNSEFSACTFKQVLTSHALLWGNGYAAIERNGRGDATRLIPLMPDRTKVVRLESGNLVYTSKIEVSDNKWENITLMPRDVLHIKGLGWDGTHGHSVISLARNSWGLGLAMEKYGGRFFKNDARPGGYLELAQGTSRDDARQMLKDWNDKHQSADNAHLVGALVNGKFHEVGMPNDDAQFLESRQFQRAEIASWFMLSPHKVNDLTHATFSNIEELQRDYLNTTLMRWLVAWEEECNEKLLSEREKMADSHFFEFNTSSLLRGTLKDRYEAYSIGIAGTWLSPNEVRAFENMNPRDGGDEYQNPNTSSPNSNNEPPPDDTDATDDNQDDSQSNAQAIARQVFGASLKRVIRTECRRVEHFAKTAKNFIGAIDGFYDRFPATILEVISAAGGTDADAEQHCEASKSRLLDVAGNATAESLLALICGELETWLDRADDLADTLWDRRMRDAA